MIRQLASDDISGLSINKQSNSAVYVQWADVNPTVPQYRIRLWYNGNLRLDKILSGQDAANNYYIWYIDYPPYALMPGDVIKAEVTPYAGGIAVGNPYTASATIQATPNSQEPIAVTQTTPVQNTTPPAVPPIPPPQRVFQPPADTPVFQPSAPPQRIIPPPAPAQRVTQPPADTYEPQPVFQPPPTSPIVRPTEHGIIAWIKSHVLLSIGILGAGVIVTHNVRKS